MKNRIILLIVAVLILSASPLMTSEAKANGNLSEEIAAYALKFKGVPYKFGGTTPSGFDCSGYILYVYKHFGISLPRTSAEQFNVGKAVSKSDLQKGDLVFYANTYKPGISHTGVYLGNGNVISAESRGINISNIYTNPYWGPKYAGARRVISEAAAEPVVASKPVALPPVTDGNFVDVATTHPAYEAIKTLNLDGVINGYDRQDFRPDTDVTRGQAATMVNKVLKLTANNPVAFRDVAPNHAFAKDIAAMNEAGILSGFNNGAFGMYSPLTKSQLAIILERAFNLSKAQEVQAQTASVRYLDVTSSTFAYKSILALKAVDETTVFQTSNFYGNYNADRAEFAAALYSAMRVN